MEEVDKESELKLTIDERKRKVKDFLFKKQTLLVIVGLIFLIWLAWYIRTANVPALKDITTNDYTLGPDLDPFLFLRYAKNIVENGKLMEHDSMRYVPLGFNTNQETKILPYSIAYFHKIFSLFSKKSINYSAVIFPAFMFLLTVVAFFLFIREIFINHKYKNIIALISSAFLIVAPSLLPRTIAGIPEKESLAVLFMFLSFYFFLYAWRTEKITKCMIFAALAGISTGLMGLVWRGAKYVFLVVGFFALVEFFSGKIDKKRFLYYSTWIFLSCLVMAVFFPARYNVISLIDSPASSGFSLGIFALLFVDFLIFNTKIKNLNFIRNLKRKIPDRLISLLFLIIIGVIFLSLFFGIFLIPRILKDVFEGFTRTGMDRFSISVAENIEPYFNDWASNFDPIVRGIPLIFWLFFIGSIFLFYDAIKGLGKKEKWILTSSYVLFLFGLVFSRYSSSSIMNGISTISKIIHYGGFLLLLISGAYVFYNYYKKKELKILKKINYPYMFLLIFLVVSLIGAKNAVRLFMILAIPASIIIAYFSVDIIEKFKKIKDKTVKLIFIVIAIIIILATIYSFYHNYKEAMNIAKITIPSAYTQQWQTAMKWVRENTLQDSVFAHWWDYGYWVQSIGNRATILDGGNAIGYWNHLLGRHVLTGQTEKEALEFLYTHNATHLLIDSSEIGKYGAYASIGSDENYDRYSRIAVFSKQEKETNTEKNETTILYSGEGLLIDEDYLFNDENGIRILIPAQRAYIGGVFLKENFKGELENPRVVFVYKNKQIIVPLKCVYYNNKKFEFEEGYKGCLYIFQKAVIKGENIVLEDKGAAIFITERGMRALWVKLYLFNETENFELVHTEDNLITKDLKNSGLNAGDFVYYQEVQGPIKIWKINYPKDIKANPEYLKTDYPEILRIVS